ncbi:MAG: type II toxin-antitoxin system HicB family antitoxin [Candidatus Hydrogenedentes bacterium]|nr:type II toxin-antitoxin system HicB family antitoxin [Candidatus Hydrogenedentota bacterium]
MQHSTYRYYGDEDMWIGWLEDYPDYRTQGESLAELEENLRDVFAELTNGALPCVVHMGELALQ